ncbi:InlB B-repeat-containing protein [Candidatus Methanomassiliicoccus intestinalis]|mgnify:FL=1|jgi:uncharacterized repeat protein (TIGR02543 family)|uniref:InlB B-repeat-containing protein n=1 Tax=Candidatus Methanomassiliicoccus intestinalis TaxID=1406512 RepID=UPI0037DCD722
MKKAGICLLSVLAVCLILSANTDTGECNDIILGNKSLPDGTILSDDGKTLINASSAAVNYTIPDTVETVAGYAFFKCSSIKSITFQENVKTIESHAFDGLGLITVNVPKNAPYMSSIPPFFNIVTVGGANYTVTFESNGGSAVASQNISEGESASRPVDPVKSGYVFGGWYRDAALSMPYTFGTAVGGNITLYAKWYEDIVFTSVPSVNDIIATADGRTITFSLDAEDYVYIIWNMGDDAEYTTYGNSITHCYERNGSYTVTATAVNSYGSAAPVTYNIDIENNEKSSIGYAAVLAGCIIAAVCFILVFYFCNIYWAVLSAAFIFIIYCILIFSGVFL